MFTFILASIGTLGIGGFIALAIFAPPIAAQVAKAAIGILDQLLSTRWGVGLLVAVACLIFGNFYFDHRGAARCQAKWDKEKIEYAKEMDALRSKAQAGAETNVEQAQNEEQKKDATDAKDVHTFEQNKSAADCGVITDDDLRAAGRLQDNRSNGRPNRKNP